VILVLGYLAFTTLAVWTVRRFTRLQKRITPNRTPPDRPVPVALTDKGLDALTRTVLCPWCTGQRGGCTCTTDCGGPRCAEGELAEAVLNAHDMRFMAAHATWRPE
jgi:hypothetical protein